MLETQTTSFPPKIDVSIPDRSSGSNEPSSCCRCSRSTSSEASPHGDLFDAENKPIPPNTSGLVVASADLHRIDLVESIAPEESDLNRTATHSNWYSFDAEMDIDAPSSIDDVNSFTPPDLSSVAVGYDV